MKTRLLIVLALVFWAGTSCEKKIDIAKEEAAIKAFFEKNSTDYFNGDYSAMSQAWVKDTSSVKMWISDKGLENIVGWENIAASEKKEVQDRTWDPKEMKFAVSFYHFDVMEDCAWVLSNTKWEGTINGIKLSVKQNRISVLKKIDGQWKLSLFAFYKMPD
jgi:uncharacterized GH25 family protein